MGGSGKVGGRANTTMMADDDVKFGLGNFTSSSAIIVVFALPPTFPLPPINHHPKTNPQETREFVNGLKVSLGILIFYFRF